MRLQSTLPLIQGGPKKWIFVIFWGPKIYFSKGNFMRGIDCANSRTSKTIPWPWFREIDVCIEAKIEKLWNFSLKIILLGVISCEESIARIPEAWKRFPDSGKLVHVGFSFQYTLLFPWIRVKEAFSRFGNARNRFFAWFMPILAVLAKKFFDRD